MRRGFFAANHAAGQDYNPAPQRLGDWATPALRGRDFVTPDDAKTMAVPALAHRLILQPELWVTKVTEDEIVRDLLHKVPTPKTED